MPIRGSDPIADVLGSVYPLSPRERNFAWIAVAQVSQAFQLLNTSKLPDEVIAYFLERDEIFRAVLAKELNNYLVPEVHLDWIDESDRQFVWIKNGFYSHFPSNQVSRFRKLEFVPQYLTGRARSIAIFDYSFSLTGISNDERISFYELLRSAWKQNTRLDRHFSWLDKDEGGCYSFLWDWMQSRTPLVTGRTRFFNGDGLLGFFDQMDLPDLEKVLLIQKAQRAWNQRRQREKMKGRKQCNFVLSNSVILKLEKLSLKHGLSRTEIVELIIDSEARSEFYIKERLMRNDLLTTPLTGNSIP